MEAPAQEAASVPFGALTRSHAVLTDLAAYVSGSPDWDGGLHAATWAASHEAAHPLPQPAELARLAGTPGLWAPPDGATARALQRTQLHLARTWGRAPETVVKAWSVIQLCHSGRRLERCVVATDAALYRCTFSSREGEVTAVKRVPWALYAQAQCGPLHVGGPPQGQQRHPQPRWGVHGWASDVLEDGVDGSYGLRLFNRRPVGTPPKRRSLLAGATFWQEDVVDNGVFVTFLAHAPAHICRAGHLAVRAYSRDTAAEMALVCFGCMLHAVAAQPQALGVTVCVALPSLQLTASSPLLAALHCLYLRDSARDQRDGGAAPEGALHSAAGMQHAIDRRVAVEAAGGQPAMPPPPHQPADQALPQSGKLVTRRCM